MSHRDRISDLIYQFAAALLLAFGLSGAYTAAFLGKNLLGVTLPTCAVLCLGLTAGLELLPGRWKLLLLLPAAAAAGIYLTVGGFVREWIQAILAAILAFRGVEGAALPYLTQLAAILATVFSLFAVLTARTEDLAVGAGLGLVLTSFPILYRQDPALLAYALPVLAALLLILASRQGKNLLAIPLALAVTVAAGALLPPAGTVQPDMEDFAQDIRDNVADYLLFSQERDVFSLAEEGFQPLVTRLGGDAMPDPSEVMALTGTPGEELYLRARSFDLYDGRNWYDSVSGARHLFYAPRLLNDSSALRDRLFNMLLPSGGGKTHTLKVLMLSDAATTVCTPQRIRSFTGSAERMVLYFNDASELFITRNLTEGDGYTLEYLPLSASDPAVRAQIAAAAGQEDPDYEDICRVYAQSPEHIQQEIFALAADVTAGIADPLAKAEALAAWLSREYRYTLTPGTPPEDVDFTADFLLRTKEGYCTYFATSLTVLCRMCGIPARYVVGYHAVLDADGTAVLTGAKAHAWTEIYLNGFGWLTLDATAPLTGESSGSGPDTAPDDAPTPTPTSTPTQEPTPTPSPQDDPSSDGSSPSSPPDDPQAPAEEETPTPPPAADPSDQNGSQSPDRETLPGGNAKWWWILLILLLLLLLLWLRLRATDPLRRARGKGDNGAQVLYLASFALLEAEHGKKPPETTWLEYAAEQAPRCPGLPLREAAEDLCACVYGTRRQGDLELAEKFYSAALSHAGRKARFITALRRLIRAPRIL